MLHPSILAKSVRIILVFWKKSNRGSIIHCENYSSEPQDGDGAVALITVESIGGDNDDYHCRRGKIGGLQGEAGGGENQLGSLSCHIPCDLYHLLQDWTFHHSSFQHLSYPFFLLLSLTFFLVPVFYLSPVTNKTMGWQNTIKVLFLFLF